MKRRASISLLAILTLSALSVHAAQHDTSVTRDNYTREKSSKRSITISGMVGSEGKTLVSDKDNRIWKVVNPDLLSRSEGRRVFVKAYANSESSEIDVRAVRIKEERAMPKLDDAAFRR